MVSMQIDRIYRINLLNTGGEFPILARPIRHYYCIASGHSRNYLDIIFDVYKLIGTSPYGSDYVYGGRHSK